MDVALIRTWLDLPPGPWPPEPRALLGLHDNSTATAEQAALKQMARLRAYQLLHPDLVTEGMNRIAQALLAVSAAPAPVPSAAPARPTTSQPQPAPTPPTLEPPPPISLEPVALEVAPPPPSRRVKLRQPRLESPIPPTFREPAYQALPLPSLPPVETEALPIPAGLARLTVSANRRAAYRTLAGLRRLAVVWDELALVAGDPSERLDSPTRACLAVEAQATFREALHHTGLEHAELARLAPRMVAVFNTPLPLATLRSLTPDQRGALARDWAIGRQQLARQRIFLRNALRHDPQSGIISPFGPRGWGRVRRNPEFVLIGIGLVSGLVALVRWMLA